MTIDELEEIITLMDYDRICAEIEKRGFRRAGENGVWEFKPLSLWDNSNYKQEIVKIDKNTGNHFQITLYKDCTDYEGMTFIDVHLSKITTVKRKPVPIPKKSILFTDAPINEDYLRDINSIVKCSICQKEYVKKELIDYYGELFCGRCFCFQIKRKG